MALPRSHWRLPFVGALTIGALFCWTCCLSVNAEDKRPAADDTGAEKLDFFGDPLPKGALARLGCVHLRHQGPATDVIFIDGDKTVVSSGHDGVIRFWDATTGKTVRTISGPWVCGGQLLGKGELLFAGSTLWDVKCGKEVFDCDRIKSVADKSPPYMVVSPDGKTVAAAGGTEKDIVLVDTASGKILHTLHGHAFKVVTLAFSPDGKTLASADEFYDVGMPDESKVATGIVRLWDVDKGKEIAQLKGHEKAVDVLAFSPDGKQLAASGYVSTLVWDLPAANAAPQRLKVLAATLRFSPDGKKLACGGKSIVVVDLADPDHLREMTRAPEFVPCHALRFSADGKTLAGAMNDGAVLLWDVATGKERLRPFAGHRTTKGGQQYRWPILSGPQRVSTNGVSQVQLSFDGKTAATCGVDNCLCVWDTTTGKQLRHFDLTEGDDQPQVRGISWIALSPDGKYAAATSERGNTHYSENTLTVWDVDSGKAIRVFKGKNKGQGGLNHLNFLPDGRLLAIDQSHLRCWKVKTGEESQLLKVDQTKAELLCGAADAGLIVIARDQGQLKTQALVDKPLTLWDLKSGKQKPFDFLRLFRQMRVVGLENVDMVPSHGVTTTDSSRGTRMSTSLLDHHL